MSHPHALGLGVQGIRKSYGTHEVLRGVDLRVEPGQILSLLGQDGAGEPMLITTLYGLRRTNSRSISVCGRRPASTETAQSIGYTPQELGICPDLSAVQDLAAFGELYGLGRRKAASRAGEVADLLGLTEKQDQRVSHLSGEQQRGLRAGMAVVYHPRLAFMDEPTVDAGVGARNQILRMVCQLSDEGAAVICTSHYLTEFEEPGPDIAILGEGRIVTSGTLGKIISSHRRVEVTLKFSRSVASFNGWNVDGRLLWHIRDEADPGSQIGKALASPALQDTRLTGVCIRQTSLYNTYLQTIEKSDHVTT